jgi:hypothetical protein
MGQGWWGSAPRRRSASSNQRSQRLHPDQFQPGRSTAPASIVVLPVLFEGDVKAAIELASFGEFSDVHLAFLDQLTHPSASC